MNRRLLYTLIATLPATLPTWCGAAALGEVLAQSAIGAPFRVEIRLVGDDATSADCLQLRGRRGYQEETQAITQGQLRIAGDRLILTSPQRGEVIASFTLENNCNGLSREYTLLLSPPQVSPAQPARSAPPAARTAPLRPAPDTPPAPSRQVTWVATEGESLSDMAMALYPRDAGARQRFIAAAVRANPELFPDAADVARPLDAGTEFKVPSPASLASAPAPRSAARPRPAPPPAPPAEKPAAEKPPAAAARHPALSAPSQDKLVIEAGQDQSAGKRNQQAGAGAPGGSTDSYEERERRLLENLNNVVTAQLQLAERLAQLEAAQKKLIEELERVKNQPAVSVAAPPPPAPSPQDSSNWLQLLLFLSGGVALAGALLYFRRSREDASGEAAGYPEAPPPLPPSSPLPPPAAYSLPPLQDQQPAAGTMAAAEPPAQPGPEAPAPALEGLILPDLQEPETEEHDSAIELAEIMLSFGRVQGAAETLADFIRANPKQAVSPWLKLLGVYRIAGMRGEFDALSRQLNKTFNVKVVSWDNFDEATQSTDESVEQLPHIIDNLTRLWPTRACQDYLEQLLRDNREGTRQGFPFAVVDELLMLSGMLNLLLGPRREDGT